MGCSGSSEIVNDETVEENNHHIGIDTQYEKGECDLTRNPNKYITECKTYFKDQSPEGVPFEDKIFPSTIESLKGKYEIPNSDSIEFKSAKEIWGDDLKIFGDKISLEDISLGSVKDAYLVSSLSSLAEFPNVVVQLFRTFTLPDDGSAIEVVLKIEGVWTVIPLDDKFPCKKQGDNYIPIFSSSKTKCIWGVILEKAWAKISNGWGNIQRGLPSQILQATTPFTTVPIYVPKENKVSLWKNIKYSDQYNCIMTCYIKEGTANIEKVGLLKHLSFSLVSAFEKTLVGRTYRLMKIRNPFGEGEWKGRFSDNSDAWTDELKRAFNFEAKNDGIFWIDYDDFIKYFHVVHICVPVRPLKCTTIPISLSNASKFNVLRLKLENPGILSISIQRQTARFHEDIDKNEYVVENLFLAKIEGKNLVIADTACDETMSSKLESGEYIALFNVDYKTAGVTNIRPYSLSVSCSTNFKSKLLDPDEDLSLLKSIIVPSIEKLHKYASILKKEFPLFSGNRFENTSIGFFYMKNSSEETKYVKPIAALLNYKSLEGELPDCLVLKNNDKYIHLINRIDFDKPFRSGVGVKYLKMNVSGSVECKPNYDVPTKYLDDITYDESNISYEFYG